MAYRKSVEKEKQVEGEDEGLQMRISQYAVTEQSVPVHNCIA